MFVDFRIIPEEISNESSLRKQIQFEAGHKLPEKFKFKIVRRNIDARGKQIYYVLRAQIYLSDIPEIVPHVLDNFSDVSSAEEVHIVGAGPCGYFAALKLISLGLKPIVFERGKDVRSRRKDLKAIQQFSIVNPHSNYCFGEGGAGTYSDGKLYTRSTKRGNILDVLNLLVHHGAGEDILVDVHPHIGSNKLPQIVTNIRDTILHFGGEVHFDSFMDDLTIKDHKIQSIQVNHLKIPVKHLILAAGHSSREIYLLLRSKGIELETKGFALGVRLEHPQALIDEIQYHQIGRHENLPPASYSMACQIGQQGVFSFCMCPGGLIVPAATAAGEIVVNGMSLSRRDSPYANSGLVTEVSEEDLKSFSNENVLAGMFFQKFVEQEVFKAGDGTQKAPAQRLPDFIHSKLSRDLPASSYIPGLINAPLHEIIPSRIYTRLKEGIKVFGTRMKKYITEEAIVVATESRTSAPVKIPRDKDSNMHIKIKGLFPAGEGAGYAGGILSAAMDGQKIAEAVYNVRKII
ncbi:MAG: FAD-binding protein [Bacteroidota bacterium]|nr:FAD-binding protein [Bacteroidota bacterium]